MITPLYGVRVPVVAHHLADPEKGTGIAMICTFGDTTDVVVVARAAAADPRHPRYRRPVQGRAARRAHAPRASVAYEQIAGRNAKQAQKIVVEQLHASGELEGEPRPITHPVKFFEKGERPLEIVTSRQWYLRNGGRDLDLRAELLALGTRAALASAAHARALRHLARRAERRLARQPAALLRRAVPASGTASTPTATRAYDDPLLPSDDALPVDPSTDCPPGFTEDQRDQPGGFTADPDVMDTWATSSLTPQIATGWVDDPDLFERTFPMNLRPQGPEIIRTWLFDTVVRARLEHGALPWTDTTINGWVLDPDRKKMSKSKGNVVTPMPLVEEYGADALRYWACNGRPGVDTAVDFGIMKVGRKLAIKMLNASKFVLGVSGDAAEDVTRGHDRARPFAARRARRARRRRDRRRSTTSTTRARSNAPSGSSGRSATTTSSS